jgi:outer membrane protein assembly factor BamB
MQDTVFAIDTAADMLKYLWRKSFKYGYDHTPSMIMEKNGTAFFAVRNGLIYAFDGRSSAVKWKYKYGNTFINTVLPLDGNSVLITNMDGDAALIRSLK